MTDRSTQQPADESAEILLVEDNPGDVRLVQEAFQEIESETTLHIVTDGNDALKFLAQQGEYESASLPDLVLLDLNLPRKDGCEVLEAITDDRQHGCPPVVMLTSSEASEDIIRCYEADANAYLAKPTDPDEFVSIAEAIERFWFKQAHIPSIPQ